MDESSLQYASEGTLEHFLLERYSLLSQTPDGRFFTADVIHEPYGYRIPTELDCDETYTAQLLGPGNAGRYPDHVAFSPGVDVRVTALVRVK